MNFGHYIDKSILKKNNIKSEINNLRNETIAILYELLMFKEIKLNLDSEILLEAKLNLLFMLFRSSMIIQFREHYFNCLEYLIGKDSIVDEEIKEITEKIIKKYSELNYSYYNRKLDMNRKKLLYIVREEGNIIGKNYPYSYIYGICKAVKILKRFENMDRISLKEIYLDKNLGKEKLTKQEIEETIVYIKNI
ncbi:MAG: hypothetical protein HXK70_00225 [Clostridiales bacterium]|nr:hypothetical protein [Clostridiales bacterium]